jgi:hypothetical protein
VANATVIVLVVGAVGTVMVLGFVVLVQVQRVRRAYGEATDVIERMKPLLDDLAEQQQVTSRELSRVGEAVDALGEAREARRRV